MRGLGEIEYKCVEGLFATKALYLEKFYDKSNLYSDYSMTKRINIIRNNTQSNFF